MPLAVRDNARRWDVMKGKYPLRNCKAEWGEKCLQRLPTAAAGARLRGPWHPDAQPFPCTSLLTGHFPGTKPSAPRL